MITFFPVPYPDELLYSIIARYHIRSANSNVSHSIKDLYADSVAIRSIELPTHIESLVSNLPIDHLFSNKEIIYKHTLYLLYKAFLEEGKSDAMLKHMESRSTGRFSIRMNLYSRASQVAPFFKYCPECMKSDFEKHGESYWRRSHQAAGVLVCTQHKVQLRESEVPTKIIQTGKYIIPSVINCNVGAEKSKVYTEKTLLHLLNVSEKIKCLLNNDFPNKAHREIREFYVSRLRQFKYLEENSEVASKSLSERFIEYYGEECLTLLKCEIRNTEYNWLMDILHKNRKINDPIQNILICNFLNIDFKEIFSEQEESRPFGAGPWPCLNVVCPEYKNDVIQYVSIKHESYLNCDIGIFTCEICGFTYSRYKKEEEENERYQLTKVLDYGTMWRRELYRLAQQKSTIKKAEHRLGVSYMTIKRQCNKLKIERFWKHIERTRNAEERDELIFIKKREQKREQWIELLSSYCSQKVRVSKLRSINSALYMWLFRNDRDWLKDNLPQEYNTISTDFQVNWKERDKSMLAQIKLIVYELKNSKEKPQRITKNNIGERVGNKYILEKNINDMPLTKKYLNLCTENKEEFLKRKIQWAVRELKKKEKVKRSEILRMVRIDEKKKDIETFLNTLIDEANRDNK